MKKIIENIKKIWQLIKRRRLLLILLFVAVIVVANTILYLSGRINNTSTNSQNGPGIGQIVSGEFFDSSNPNYEKDSTQLVDNLPYDSVDLKISQLPSDSNTLVFSVGLKDTNNRKKFEDFLKLYKYPGNSKFVIYQLP